MRLLIGIVIAIVLSFSSVSVTVQGQSSLCLNNGNYTANDAFQVKLDSLLNSVATTNSDTMTYGLFNASVGPQQGSDGVEVMGYCRGDQSPDACRACLNGSAYQIRQMCPLYKQAVLFEENCTMKYSNGSMYGVLSTNPSVLAWNPNNATNWDSVVNGVKQLVVDLESKAASDGPIRKYDQGNGSAGLYTLYGAVQCSPDLGDQQCVECLDDITPMLTQGKVGARLLAPSCQLRYETYRFFDPIAVSLPSPSPPGNKKSSRKWIVIVASVVSAILVIGLIVLLITKRRKRRFTRRLQNEDVDDVIVVESLQFNLDVIREATENFSDARKLGQGGFGSVYLGKLPNGQEIAVKRLSKNSGQGELEFKNEVVLLARLQHRNLVRLLGFSLEGGERLLVYEFVPNSSLDQFIFDPLKRALLDWDTRYKIITGIARGLMYLHEDSRLRIIHRDLKPSNILLDADMNPKVSDFGMARLFELDQTQADTNRIVGTYGYMAPEYVLHGHFSLKSDVFSFGVLVLEIVSGRRNLDSSGRSGEDPEILISHIWRSWREGKIPNIVDPLVTSGYSADIVRCIHIGLLCIQENVANRPTMASVILMLNSNSVTLPVPTHPAFLMSTSYASDISSTLDGTSAASRGHRPGNNTEDDIHSVNNVSITEPYPR